MKPTPRILLATDFSRCSEPAGDVAARLAHQMSAAIDLVTVIDTSPLIAGSADLAYRTRLIVEMRQKAREGAERFASRCVSACAAGLSVHIRDGNPAAEIVRAAQELASDLIVMGTHGRTGLSHLLMGSVAEQVIRQSKVPVVAVPGRDADAAMPKVSGVDQRTV